MLDVLSQVQAAVLATSLRTLDMLGQECFQLWLWGMSLLLRLRKLSWPPSRL